VEFQARLYQVENLTICGDMTGKVDVLFRVTT